MLKSSPATQRRFRLFNMQIPRKLGNGGPYFTMIVINSIGYGLFAPFTVLYFNVVVGLSLPLVGLGLSIATGVGLVATPLGGPLIDRFGARTVAIGTNLLSALGFAAYLSVHSFAGFLIVAVFLAIGTSGGGAAGPALVADLAAPEDRDRWYAFVRMAFNAGAGAGALLAGWLIAGGGTAGYRWIVALNGVSFAVAAALLFLVRVHHTPGTKQAKSGNARTVLRDHPFLGLVGANAIIWMSVVALEVALPPYLFHTVHAPNWLIGLLFAINTGMIVVAQLPMVRAVASWRRTRILATGGFGYGLSFLLFVLAPLLSPTILPFYLCGCIMLYTLAEVIYAPTSTALAAALAPVEIRGRYLAIFQLSLASAATITPIISGSLLAINPQGLWVLLALLMVGAALLIIFLERRLPEAALRAARRATTTNPEQEVDAPGDFESRTPLPIQPQAHPSDH